MQKIELIATREPVAVVFMLFFNFPGQNVRESFEHLLHWSRMYLNRWSAVVVTHAELKIRYECSQ